MSLESELLIPPRGPLKHRWLKKIINEIATRAGIISPDKTVEITPLPGGGLRLIRSRSTVTPNVPNYNPWQVVKNENGTWHVDGGELRFNSVNIFPDDVDLDITPGADVVVVLCITIVLNGTGSALTPRLYSSLGSGNYTLTPAPYITYASMATITAQRSVLPGVRNSGVIMVPLAYISDDRAEQIWTKKLSRIAITLRHQDFILFYQ